MNGPEHYAEAERLLAQVAEAVSANYEHQTGERKADILAAAQAHATLAQAAATVDARRGGTHVWQAWPEPSRVPDPDDPWTTPPPPPDATPDPVGETSESEPEESGA